VYWLDTVIVAILLIGALFGAVSGLVWQIARVASFGVAIYAAIYLNDWATGVLRDLVLQGADPRVEMVLAYLLVFFVIYLAFFAATVLVERAMTVVCLQPLNKILGAGLGAVKAGLLLGAIFLGMASYPHAETQEVMNRSSLAPALADGTQLVIVAIPQEYKDWLCAGIEQLRELARSKAPALQAAGGVGVAELLPQHTGQNKSK
jgi:membrane protein required for colicin V production